MFKISIIVLAAALAFAGRAYSQSTVIVEEVVFKGKGDDSRIPRVTDKSNPNNAAVAKINTVLLDRFDLQSFDPQQAENFGYSGISYQAQVKSGLLYIYYVGEYYGASLNTVEEELYFDLATGERFTNTNIPFQSLFTLEGYLEFMDKFWLATAKRAFQEAIECADTEPSCTYYDIGSYLMEGANLVITLQSDCYPTAARVCDPQGTRTVAMDSVKKYLSPVGEKMLFRDAYASKTGIDKYLYNNLAWKELPENQYIFGLIDGKYAFSMAINVSAAHEVKGFYYYDKRKQKIALTGAVRDDVMVLKETVNGKVTGEFTMKWNGDYQDTGLPVYDANGQSAYLTGQWKSGDGKKVMPITFTAVKFTNRVAFR